MRELAKPFQFNRKFVTLSTALCFPRKMREQVCDKVLCAQFFSKTYPRKMREPVCETFLLIIVLCNFLQNLSLMDLFKACKCIHSTSSFPGKPKWPKKVHFLKFSNPLFGLNYVPMVIAHVPKVY